MREAHERQLRETNHKHRLELEAVSAERAAAKQELAKLSSDHHALLVKHEVSSFVYVVLWVLVPT